MKKRKTLTVLSCLAVSNAIPAYPDTGHTTNNGIASVSTGYTCEQADQIKFDRVKYDSLGADDRVIVDAQWNKCDRQKKDLNNNTSPDDREVVVFTNPTPTESSGKLFYGLVSRSDLDNARKNCSGAGKVAGVALTVAGAATGSDLTGQLGGAIFNYTDVSCEGLASGIEKDNLMTLIAPHDIVVHAVQTKLNADLLRNIPLVSDADKRNIGSLINATSRPPEISVKHNEVVIKAPMLPPFKIRPPKIKF